MHTRKPPQPSSEPDFRKLAKEHIRRGFFVSATKPGSKVGIWKWNSLNLLGSPQAVDKFLERCPQYAHSNVAVVGRCGFHWLPDGMPEGDIFILDVDRDGVTRQIYKENPRKKFPDTYVVQSRPQSNPAKVHVYFRHTKYSIDAFTKLAQRYAGKNTKEISGIRDRSLPKDARGLHPNRYDVKGSGKAGYVLGAGSVHSEEDGGETYTLLKDFRVADVPPWLIDWIVKDSSKEFDAREVEKAERRAHAKKVAALEPKERERLRRLNHPDGFLVSADSTYLFLLFRARYMAKQGLSRAPLKAFLIDRALDVCHDGKKFVESPEGKKAIEHILDKMDEEDAYDYSEAWLQDSNIAEDEPEFEGLLGTVPETQQTRLTRIAATFPEQISSKEVYERLGLSDKVGANRMMVKRIMKSLNYAAQNIGGTWMWIRGTSHGTSQT